MSEGILLPPLPRGTLLPASERLGRLHSALPQILSILEGETDSVALQSTLACLLWDALPQANWCGFYRRVGDAELAVGPYQGTMGCLRIPFSRGVCGAAATTGQIQRIPDVHAFPGHISCDDRSRSELVIPIFDSTGMLRAVLDLDSPSLNAFSEEESAVLVELLERVFTRREPGSSGVRW